MGTYTPTAATFLKNCEFKEHKSQSFINIVFFTMYKNYQIRHYVVLCSTNFPFRHPPPPPPPGNDSVCDHNAMSAFPQEKNSHYTTD